MKFVVSIIIIIFISWPSMCMGNEVNVSHVRDVQYGRGGSEGRYHVDDLASSDTVELYKRRFEVMRKAEEGRSVKNGILWSFAGVCALMLLAKWVSLVKGVDWRLPRVLWVLLGLMMSSYFWVAAYYDMSQDYAGAASRSGFSVVSRYDQPFLFHLTIVAKFISAVFLLWISLRHLFGKEK